MTSHDTIGDTLVTDLAVDENTINDMVVCIFDLIGTRKMGKAAALQVVGRVKEAIENRTGPSTG